MDLFIPSLHEYLQNSRFRADKPSTITKGPKRYTRMEIVPLPAPCRLETSLEETFANRTSRRLFEKTPLPLSKLSSLLFHAAHNNNHGKRPYPSGGGPYPIEIYLIAFSVEKCIRHVLHYEPDTHTLRRLWEIPEGLQHNSLMRLEGDSEPNVLMVLTAIWERSAGKYKDFAYTLGLLEAGHIGQNVLLCAEALSLAACPVGAPYEPIIPLLDIDKTREQAVYAIAFGRPAHINS